MNEQTPAAVGAPVEPTVRPLDDPKMQQLFGDAIEGALALGYACEDPPPEGHWLERFWRLGNAQSNSERASLAAERERYALPQDLADYMRSHLRRERAALDGFLALGNEAERAKRLEGWISVLSGPNVRAKQEPTA